MNSNEKRMSWNYEQCFASWKCFRDLMEYLLETGELGKSVYVSYDGGISGTLEINIVQAEKGIADNVMGILKRYF